MRIPLVRSQGDDSPVARWEWLFSPFLILLLVVGGLVSILALPFLGFALWWRERRFIRLMRAKGRFIPWKDLEARLKAGEGTLVVEQAQKLRVRVWWTQEDVPTEAPTQPPVEQELDYLRIMEPHPFVFWCSRRFLSPESGMGLLTAPPYSSPRGFVEGEFFRAKFPNLRVVMTVRLA